VIESDEPSDQPAEGTRHRQFASAEDASPSCTLPPRSLECVAKHLRAGEARGCSDRCVLSGSLSSAVSSASVSSTSSASVSSTSSTCSFPPGGAREKSVSCQVFHVKDRCTKDLCTCRVKDVCTCHPPVMHLALSYTSGGHSETCGAECHMWCRVSTLATTHIRTHSHSHFFLHTPCTHPLPLAYDYTLSLVGTRACMAKRARRVWYSCMVEPLVSIFGGASGIHVCLEVWYGDMCDMCDMCDMRDMRDSCKTRMLSHLHGMALRVCPYGYALQSYTQTMKQGGRGMQCRGTAMQCSDTAMQCAVSRPMPASRASRPMPASRSSLRVTNSFLLSS